MSSTCALPPLKNLVLCADDFALSASVSEAIVRLAQARRISATSAMVLSPRWTEDAARLKTLRGQIDVGLHLDWTSDFASPKAMASHWPPSCCAAHLAA